MSIVELREFTGSAYIRATTSAMLGASTFTAQFILRELGPTSSTEFLCGCQSDTRGWKLERISDTSTGTKVNLRFTVYEGGVAQVLDVSNLESSYGKMFVVTVRYDGSSQSLAINGATLKTQATAGDPYQLPDPFFSIGYDFNNAQNPLTNASFIGFAYVESILSNDALAENQLELIKRGDATQSALVTWSHIYNVAPNAGVGTPSTLLNSVNEAQDVLTVVDFETLTLGTPPLFLGDPSVVGGGGGGGGDVSGPGSSTDNAVVRWDGPTGTQIQNSLAILSDAGNFTTPGTYQSVQSTAETTLSGAALTYNNSASTSAFTIGPLAAKTGTDDGTTVTLLAPDAENGAGGIVNIFAGSSDGNAGGYMLLLAGSSGVGPGGDITAQGGGGSTNGGNINLAGGAGAVTDGAVILKATDGSVGRTELRFEENVGGNYVGFVAAPTIAANVMWQLPNVDGSSGQILSTDGAGVLSWMSAGGTGDVVGPASATDNAIARFDGTTGKLIQNSAVTIADTTGDITTPGAMLFKDSGSNTSGFTAPAVITTPTTWKLPVADGTSGQALITNGSAQLAWASVITSVSLQSAYNGGSSIAQSDARGAVTISDAALTVDASNLSLTKNFGSGTLPAILVAHGATNTAAALKVTQFSRQLNVYANGITYDDTTGAETFSIAPASTQTGVIPGVAVTISAQSTTNAVGGTLSLEAGSATGAAGGTAQLVSGTGTIGGALALQAGSGLTGAGGEITLAAGLGSTTGGPIRLLAGDAVTTGGNIEITGGGGNTRSGYVILKAIGSGSGLLRTALYFEETTGGNYVGFVAPSSIASNVTWTLPNADGSSGQFLSTNGGGTLSWATALTSVSLQSAYNGGSSIAQSDARGAITITDAALTSDANTLSITKNFAGSNAAIAIAHGASNTGVGLSDTKGTASATFAAGALHYSNTTSASLFLISATGTQTGSSVGTSVSILGQDGGTNADGGAVTIIGGSAGGIGTGGNVSLLAGDAVSGNGGTAFITGGDAPIATGDVNIRGGNSTAVSSGPNGGNIILTGGTSNVAVGSVILASASGIGPTPLRFREDLGSGTNSVGFVAPNSISADVLWTLPNADGSSGQFLSTNGSGVLSWQTASGGGGVTGTGTADIVTIWTGTSTIGNSTASAGNLTLGSGAGTGAGAGKSITVQPGQGGATGNGGQLILTGGAGGATSGNGGNTTITGGAPLTSGNGGNLTLGSGTAAGTNKTGGTLALTAGDSTGTGVGGVITVTAGAGGATAAGGTIALTGGAGGATSGAGGAINIAGGAATTSGAGGALTLVGGAGAGTNQNGGAVSFGGGAPTGTGTPGSATITGGDNATNVGANVILRGGRGSSAANDGVIQINRTTTDNRATRLQFIGNDGNAVNVQAPSTVTTYTIKWPTAQASGTQVLQNDGSGNLSWATASTGTVTGTGTTNTVPAWSSSTSIADSTASGGTILLGSGVGAGAGAGQQISILPGIGGATGAGGPLNLSGGPGGATSGTGGAVTVQGGTAANGDGGAVNINGGASGTSGTGGVVAIIGGAGSGTNQPGGGVTVTGGVGTGSGVPGAVTIKGANAVSSTTGGATSLRSGDGNGGNPAGTITVQPGAAGATGTGGLLNIAAGTGGSTSGAGGVTTVTGGAGNGNGAGGALTLVGGAGGGSGQSGGAATLTGGTPTGVGTPGPVTIKGANAAAGGTTGGTTSVRSGDGISGGSAGAITVQPGAAGPTGGGGAVTVQGGAGGSTSGIGGTLNLNGGAATTSGGGGPVNINGGTAVGTNQNGGGVTIIGGAPTGTGTAGAIAMTGAAGVSNTVGSTITLTAGAGNGTAAGAAILLKGGNGGSTGIGGAATLQAGSGGGTSGAGGAANVTAGNSTTSGAGGAVNLTAGAGAGTNQNGGNVVVTPGAKTGSGTDGTVQIGGNTNSVVTASAGRDLYIGAIPAATAANGAIVVQSVQTTITTTGSTAVNGSVQRVNTGGGAIATLNLPNPNVSAGQSILFIKITADVNTYTLKSPAGNINTTLGSTGVAFGVTGLGSVVATCDGTDWWVF